MLTNEVEIIEGYFDFVCIRPSIRDAWNHIKKELSGSGQNSAEEAQPQAGTQQIKGSISLLNKAWKFLSDRPATCDGCAVMPMISAVIAKLNPLI